VPDDSTTAELIAAFRRGAAILSESIEGMDDEALRARPVAGKMSTLEVVCHIADCDQFLADRMKRTIATDEPVLMGVDAITYLGALHYHDRDPAQEIALVDVTRSQLADDLERVPSAAWARTSTWVDDDGSRESVTLLEWLEHTVEHLEGHVETIREKRAALGLG
jgi:uncharacterized damage-inducible protein DinB